MLERLARELARANLKTLFVKFWALRLIFWWRSKAWAPDKAMALGLKTKFEEEWLE